MTYEGQTAAAAEEMARAEEELRAADHLMRAPMPRIALTRASFACFHAARSLLYLENLEPRSHEGVWHLFNLHFVRPRRFPTTTSKLIARLQKFREEADYAASFVIDEAGAREEIEAARGFVELVAAERARHTSPS